MIDLRRLSIYAGGDSRVLYKDRSTVRGALMQRLVLVLLMSLVLAACGSDETEALRRIAVAGDGSGNVGCYSSPTFDNRACLRLGGLGLRQLPPEIGRLKNLQTLELYDNQLTTLPPEIERLPKLKILWVNGNPLDAASRALLPRLEVRGVYVCGL